MSKPIATVAVPMAGGPVAIPPLVGGERLTRAEFERRYAAMPDVKGIELIEVIPSRPRCKIERGQQNEEDHEPTAWRAVNDPEARDQAQRELELRYRKLRNKQSLRKRQEHYNDPSPIELRHYR